MAVTNPGGTVAYSPQAAGPPFPPLVPTHSGSRTVSIPGVPSVVVSVSSKPINVRADAAEGCRPIRMVGPVICLAAGFLLYPSASLQPSCLLSRRAFISSLQSLSVKHHDDSESDADGGVHCDRAQKVVMYSICFSHSSDALLCICCFCFAFPPCARVYAYYCECVCLVLEYICARWLTSCGVKLLLFRGRYFIRDITPDETGYPLFTHF